MRVAVGWTALLLPLLLVLACAGAPPERPRRLPDPPREPAGFETPPILDARDVLPESLRRGEHHDVADRIVCDGFEQHFSISSDYGDFEAHNRAMLGIRVDEIRALAEIERIRATKVFLEAAKEAALSPMRGLRDLVVDPLDTVAGIPKGMWHYVKRVSYSVTTGGRSEHEDGIAASLLGLDATRRALADDLGVDPYSSNPVLREELDELSWVAFAGEAPILVGKALIPGGAGHVIGGLEKTRTLNRVLRESTPTDLRMRNRDLLEAMGTDPARVEEFLRHPWYSPRQATLLVAALDELEGVVDRPQFMRAAITAESEENALMFRRMAEMLLGHHENVSRLRRIHVYGEALVLALSVDGDLVLPGPVDYLVWCRRTAVLAEGLDDYTPSGFDVRRRRLWITGTITPRCRREIRQRGWEVVERSGETLGIPD